MHGKAITVIISGNTLGTSIGPPAMTAIGLTFGWRSVFLALGGIVAVIVAFLAERTLRSSPSPSRTK